MLEDLNDAFCNRLRQLRAHFKMTQEKVAERAGLHYKHYQEIERGAKIEVRFSTLAKIAQAFELSIRDLFTEELPDITVAERPPSSKLHHANKVLPRKKKVGKTKKPRSSK